MPDPHINTTYPRTIDLSGAVSEWKRIKFEGFTINRQFSEKLRRRILAMEIDGEIYEFDVDDRIDFGNFGNVQNPNIYFVAHTKDKLIFYTSDIYSGQAPGGYIQIKYPFEGNSSVLMLDKDSKPRRDLMASIIAAGVSLSALNQLCKARTSSVIKLANTISHGFCEGGG